MGRGRSRACAAVALLALALGARGVSADEPVVYKWVDENGIAHYTTDRRQIPRNLRGRIREVERSSKSTDAQRAAPEPPTAPTPRVTEPAAAPPRPPAPSEEAAPAREDPPEEPRAPARETSAPAPQPAPPPVDAGPRSEPEQPPEDETLDARIARLEREIRRDEDALKALIAERGEEGRAPDLYARPELREIALRLPKLQAELRALQSQRAARDER